MATESPEVTTNKPRARRSSVVRYARYIKRVLNVVAPGMSINKVALTILEKVLELLIQGLTQRAVQVCDKPTLNGRNLEAAALSLVTNRSVVAAGEQAVANFTESKMDSKSDHHATPIAATARAHVIIPPSIFRAALGKSVRRVTETAPVFCAGVTEAVLKHILTSTLEVARAESAKRIQLRHVVLAVQNDAELAHVIVNQLGVVLPVQVVAPPHTDDKRRKTRRAVKVQSNIRKSQSSTHLQLQKLPFKRWVAAVTPTDVQWRYAHDFHDTLQQYIEARAVELFRSARLLTEHAGRQVMRHSDVHILTAIQVSGLAQRAPPAGKSVCPKRYLHGLRRLSRKAGVTSITTDALLEAHRMITAHLAAVMNGATIVTHSQQKHIVTTDHLRAGLALNGISAAL